MEKTSEQAELIARALRAEARDADRHARTLRYKANFWERYSENLNREVS